MIYFAQAGDGGPIKIGVSSNPAGRVSSLRSASPVDIKVLALMIGDFRDEAALHNRFAPSELKAWRRASGKTQKEASDWLRVPLRTYQKWEQGERVAHNPGPIKLRMAAVRGSAKPERRPKQDGLFDD